jgi:hypothetical protein
MAHQLISKPAAATGPLGLELLSFLKPSAGTSGNLMTSWPQYMIDALQPSVLFLDLLATRSGDVPLGALFYLLRRELFDAASLEKMLYERARLLGLSGISDDMRVL